MSTSTNSAPAADQPLAESGTTEFRNSYIVRDPSQPGTFKSAQTDGPGIAYNNNSSAFRPPSSTGHIVEVKPSTSPTHYGYNNYQPNNYSSSTPSGLRSEIEQAVISAKQPLDLRAHEVINAGPFRGLYLNKHEVDSWRGPIPIDQYPIHNDPNPEVIKKRLDKVRYTQELGVRYLNPPPLPRPGDIIIRERNSSLPPAPPVVIRQEGDRSHTPPPVVFREAPPPRPPHIPEKIIEVEGGVSRRLNRLRRRLYKILKRLIQFFYKKKVGVPSPRRVVVEKMSNLPPRPPNVIVEKWLPYRPQRRRVIHQRAGQVAQQFIPRNLIIEWEAPDVEIVKQCRDLGTIDMDPEEYVRRYGSELKQTHELPTCDGQSFVAANTHSGNFNTGTVIANTHSYQPRPSTVPNYVGSSTTQMYSSASYSTSTPVNNAVATSTAVSGNRCPVHYGHQSLLRASGVGFENPELEGDLEALRLVNQADLDRYLVIEPRQ